MVNKGIHYLLPIEMSTAFFPLRWREKEMNITTTTYRQLNNNKASK